MKSTKKTLLVSILSTILCVAMLVGTTFAWFTDNVTSGANKIIAGNLDIELEYSKDCTNWATVQGNEDLFSDVSRWEPGATSVVYLKITNNGTLALNYKTLVTPVSENGGINVNGEPFKLSDYLVFKTIAHGENVPAVYTRETAQVAAGTQSGLNVNDLTQTGSLEAGEIAYITLIVYMPETVGNAANYMTGTPAPTIALGINIVATQKTFETDGFNDQYDAGAIGESVYLAGAFYEYFEAINESTTSDTDKKFDVTKNTDDTVIASASGETENAGDTVTLTVVKSADAEANFTAAVEEGHELNGYDIKVTGQKAGSLVQAKLYVGTGLQEFKFYHNGAEMIEGSKGSLTDGQYFYDSAEGYVYIATTTFSPFQSTYKAPEASIGVTPYGTLKDALGAAKAGETVTILKDIIVAELPKAYDYANEPVYEVTKSIILDGNWKTVTASTETWAKYNDKITGIIFSIGSQNNDTYTAPANVTVKNLTVIGHKDMKHGFSIVKSDKANTTATFENVTVKNCGANAFSVNGTTATMINVKTSNCGWGAIDASAATLTVKSGEYDIIKNNKNSTVNLEGGKVDILLTDNETVYHIYTAEGLRTFAVLANAGVAKKAILEANIDLENIEWTQINGADKSITFDGNGKTISNLKVSNGHNAGFFSTGSGCTIKNLTVDGATVTGIGRIGVICGHGMCVTVDNCTVKNATVTAVVTNNDDGDKAGAIVGYLSGESNASVTNCKVENVTVQGYRDVGALVGYAGGTYTITDNTLANIRVICDKSNNYKNYTTDAEYDVNFIVGEKTSDGKIENTGIIAGTYDVDPSEYLYSGCEAVETEGKYVVSVLNPALALQALTEGGTATVSKPTTMDAPDPTNPDAELVIFNPGTVNLVLNNTLTSGNLSGETWGNMRINKGSTLVVDANENGKFINTASNAIFNIQGGNLTINGGYFESEATIINAYSDADMSEVQIVINGGIFKGVGIYAPTLQENTQFIFNPYGLNAEHIHIYGGEFYNWNPSAYVATGYTVSSKTVGNDIIYTVGSAN